MAVLLPVACSETTILQAPAAEFDADQWLMQVIEQACLASPVFGAWQMAHGL